MSLLELKLLGGLALEQAGVPLPKVKSQKGLALFCYLAVSQKQQTRSFLAGLFWPDMPESQALMNLRQVLQRLKALKPYLLITRETVAFDQEANYWLDVAAFAEGTTVSQDIPSLQKAISLYQGDFLDGFMLADAPLFEEWMMAKRAQLREAALTVLQRLVAHFQEERAYEPAINYARQLLAIEPWHEETHRDLMRLLALSGQRSVALAQYETCCRLLGDELGVEPAAATVRLAEQIRAGELSAEAGGSLPAHNLRPQMTAFVGREAELAQLQQLLAQPDVHLITILGSGGMGKTRLALALAQRLLSSRGDGSQTYTYQHGVYFVSLARLETADLLLPAIAEAINFRFAAEANRQEQLLRYLAGKAMLLLLDNFEHLLAGIGLVDGILRVAPQVKIIITSRVKLNRQIEQLFPIGGMTFPPENRATSKDNSLDLSRYSAVQLFVQCARRLRPEFELTADNQSHVLEICRLVQGMPLGIVLAASWLASLPLRDISHELHQDIDFLATDMEDVPRRQRSLRAAFDHSWRLLSEREQKIFCQMSIFRGGFTRVAGQAVTGATLRDLQALVSKSLLMLSPERRYDVHELLRQFAAEKLNQTPSFYETARDAHCDYYCAFLHKRENDLKTSRKAKSLEEIRAEQENVRAAWKWAAEQGHTRRLEEGLESLATFYQWHGRYQEGEEALQLASKKIDGSDDKTELHLLIRVLIWRASFNLELGRTEIAKQLSKQSLDLSDNPSLSSQEMLLERAAALYCLGFATLRHDFEEAHRLWSHSLELYEAGGYQWGTAEVLGHLAMIDWEQGRYDEAKRLIEKNLVIQQALGNQTGIGDMFSTLGWIALTQGQLEQAEQLAQKCTTFYREAGDKAHIAKGLRDLAAPKIFLGRFSEAEALLEESVDIFNKLGGGGDLVFTHILLGATKTQLGQYEQAHAWVNLGLQLARKFDDRAGEGRALLWLGRIALVEEGYPGAQALLQESVAIFREVGQKDQLSAALTSLGYSSRAAGDQLAARRYLMEALETSIEIGAFLPLLFAIPLAALLAADRGEKERAIELYALASRYPFVTNSRWCGHAFGRQISTVASTFPTEVVTAAQERGKSRNMWSTANELLAELG